MIAIERLPCRSTPNLNMRLHSSLASVSVLLLSAVAWAAPVTFNLQVTPGFAVPTSGLLDIQFNPGTTDSPAATATLTDFTFFNPALESLGTVLAQDSTVGSLPATVQIQNTQAVNGLLQEITLSQGFRFQLTLDGPGLSASGALAGSTFGLFLLDQNGAPLVGSDPTTGAALQIDIDGEGQTTLTGSTIAGPISTVIPEPGSLMLVAAGMTGLLLFRKR